MRVFKNLFGDGSKIHASEVVTKNAAGDVVGMDQAGMEMGKNTNGHYIRWNFGLQICWISPIVLAYVHTGLLRASWTYPAEFKSGSTPAGFANPREYAPVVSARTAGTVVSCGASSCSVSASAPAGTFGEDDTWNFQAVVIGWWKEPGT